MFKFAIILLLAFTLQATVLQLDKHNFKQALEDHPLILVKFYIDGCSHCAKMKPVFEKLSERLQEYQITLGEVNANENKALTAKQDIKVYPTIVMYRQGQSHPFPQSSDSIDLLFEYALQHAYGYLTDLNTKDQIDLFIKRSNIAVLAFNNEDLSGQAINNRWVKYGQVRNMLYKQGHDYEIYSKKLPEPLFFDGTKHELNQFINSNAYPQFFTFTEEEFNKAAFDRLPLIAMISMEEDIIFKRLKYISESMSNRFRLVLIPVMEDLPKKRMEFQLGHQVTLKPGYLYGWSYNNSKGKEFKMENEDVKDLKEYIEIILTSLGENDQKQQEEVKQEENKQEEIKKEVEVKEQGQVNTESETKSYSKTGTVIQLKASNFKEIVLQSKVPVFVKFFAPWCGHCKAMAQAYQDLAKKLQNEDVVIAEMDWTQEKVGDVDIKGFPTLILFRNGEQSRYSGSRSTEAMSSFILKKDDL